MEEIKEAHEAVIEAFRQGWKDLGWPTWSEVLQMNYDFFEHAKIFIDAVNWTEPLLLGIGAFHLMTLIFVIVSRKNFNLQVGTMFILCSIVLGATYLNELGMKYWRSIATQPYFSPNGLFISAVLSFPLILISIIIMMNVLRSIMYSMAKVKRMQFQREAALKAAKKTE